MSEVLSTWPVVVELPLGAEDRDADGTLTEAAVDRLFAEGRVAYAAECPELDLADADVTDLVLRRGSVAAPGQVAVVGVAVVEVFPDSFTMEARIRPAEGSGVAATAACVVVPAGGVTDALRARLIALAQTARHHH
jgi:acyl-CoA thioesterase FadM